MQGPGSDIPRAWRPAYFSSSYQPNPAGLTQAEDEYVSRVWAQMSGRTCWMQAITLIAKGGVCAFCERILGVRERDHHRGEVNAAGVEYTSCRQLTDPERLTESVACPSCSGGPGMPCTGQPWGVYHGSRHEVARRPGNAAARGQA